MSARGLIELSTISNGCTRDVDKEEKFGVVVIVSASLWNGYSKEPAHPFRQVADQFGIHPESLRRLAQRDGVTLRARGEKLTPTQRRLTPEQQQEARALVGSGVSLRQAARQVGISRCALEGLLKEGEQERQ